MVAAERSWSLEVGLGGSCWCRDGASHPQRAGAELTQAAGMARETCWKARGWTAPALPAPPGIATRDAALLLRGGGSAPAL